MKSVQQFSQNALSSEALRNTKGGTGTTITLETQVDIVTINPQGSALLLFCDRRRKKVNV